MSELRRTDDALELPGLFRYVFDPTTDPRESSRPYFHPLTTLGGKVVTIFRPDDHVWHHGLSMTAHLSGQNFWGGHTYVHGQGYVQRDNNGTQKHVAFDEVAATSFVERLRWLTFDGAHWLDERRRVEAVVDSKDAWSLHFATELANVSGRRLEFSSPTVEGRPMAGYGGLFWRGPASWTGGEIVNAQMGESAPWIALKGPSAASAAEEAARRGRQAAPAEAPDATVAFVDDPSNPRYPTKWFVRREPYACIAAAFSFDEILELPPGEKLRLSYRVVIADGEFRVA